MAGPRLDARIGQKAFAIESALGDGQSVEGDVPDQLAPLRGRQVGRDPRRHARGFEGRHQGFGSRSGRTPVFAERDVPLPEMVDHAVLGAIDAGEAQSPENTFASEAVGQPVVVAQTVLQSEQRGVRMKERGKDLLEGLVGGGLEGDHDQILRTHFLGTAEHAHRSDGEVALHAAHPQTVFFPNLEIPPDEERDIETGGSQPTAVIGADRATANHGDAPRKG